MAFGLGKLAVLESKLDIYEDLSKEMLDKLERAVDKISENSNRVALILERHEARLDEGERTNEAILKLVEKVEEKIDKVEKRVDNLQKFRWMSLGVVAAIVTTVQVINAYNSSLTSSKMTSTIGGTHIEMIG